MYTVLHILWQTGTSRNVLYWPHVKAPLGCREHLSLFRGCIAWYVASLGKTLRIRLCSGVCACSTASWAPDVLGYIWTKQCTIAMHLVLWSSCELLTLMFFSDGIAESAGKRSLTQRHWLSSWLETRAVWKEHKNNTDYSCL